MGAKQKKIKPRVRIKYGGDTDRINDVEEVLESGSIGAEKTDDLGGSNDGAFRSGLRRGGRHRWDRRRHPDLQAHRIDASDSYVPPPWMPSCRRGGVGETLVQGVDRNDGGLGWWHGQGNPSAGWCVGCLYSGPASGGVRSDRLAHLDLC
jgi:hypothetical protein